MIRPALLPCLCLCACTVGPDFERPELALPETLALATPDAETVFSPAAPHERWWEVFDAPELDALVERARAQNLTLAGAVARVRAARAVVDQRFAQLLPTVSAQGQFTYQKQSLNSFRGFGGAVPGGSLGGLDEPFELYSGQAEMSYELDLWGKLRRGHEAADAESLATDEDRKAAEIALVADVVQAYFDLAEADASLEIALEAVSLREESLRLVEARTEAGLANELELRRAEGELESARADPPEARRRRRVAEHRLALLLGAPPGERFQLAPPLAFEVPPEVPVGVPTALLERRPDVRAAELQARAANARIGQVKAEFFPSVTLFGNFGYASVDLGTLTRGTSQLWGIGPRIRLPLFEGGQTYARYEEAQHRSDAAVAGYRQAVLTALREVADAMAGIHAQVQIRDRQAGAVGAVRRALELAEAQYRQGLTDYLNVLDAQRSLLTTRTAMIRAQRSLLSELVTLHKALGGGWTLLPEDEPAADEVTE